MSFLTGARLALFSKELGTHIYVAMANGRFWPEAVSERTAAGIFPDPKRTLLNRLVAPCTLVSLPTLSKQLGGGSGERIILNDVRH